MPEMSRMVEIWIFAGLGVMVLLFLMSGMARLYRKAGPHEALIVYGLGGTRVVQGHGTLVLPMVQICKDLSLELMSFDVAPQQDLYTKQGVGSRERADGGGTVSDQVRSGARRVDPAGDGRASARNYRAAYGGRNREAAGDGFRPHARHLRRRHEQDGAGGDLVHH